MYIYEFKDDFFCVIWGAGLLFMFVLVLVGAFLSLSIVRFLLAKFATEYLFGFLSVVCFVGTCEER